MVSTTGSPAELIKLIKTNSKLRVKIAARVTSWDIDYLTYPKKSLIDFLSTLSDSNSIEWIITDGGSLLVG